MSDKEIVEKNDGTRHPDEILATTYQMRNFFKQMRDGWISHLTVMNYIQHVAASDASPESGTVLDACCGRSLMRPLLRYRAKEIDRYIGIDIEASNITPPDVRVTDGKPIEEIQNTPDTPEEYFPFEVEYHIGDIADVGEMLPENSVDFVIYTSSIEHMHREHGERSLIGLGDVMKPGAKLFLSCPNTPEDQDGYDVRYQAHVYEWKLSELRSVLDMVGFEIREEIGLTGDLDTLREEVMGGDDRGSYLYQQILSYVPEEFARPVLFAPYPELASEVLLIAERRVGESASEVDW